MYIRHCGITGFKVDTGQSDAVLCDKCCFRDCEQECLDRVPCKFGWYYKETNKVKLFDFANGKDFAGWGEHIWKPVLDGIFRVLKSEGIARISQETQVAGSMDGIPLSISRFREDLWIG